MLTESKFEADTLLVHLVQLQRVHEKVIHAPWHDLHTLTPQTSDDVVECTNTTAVAPAFFYVRALQSDLDQARKGMPSDLRQDKLLVLHGYNVELSIHEAALSKTLDPAFDRLESLWAALQAVKNWFNLFLSIPPARYVGVPMGVCAQFAHFLVALSRLSTFEHPHWDLKLVKETCSLSIILDRVIDKFARVQADANLGYNSQEDSDFFSSNVRRITAIKQWWDAKLAAEQSATTEPLATTDEPSNVSTATDPMLAGPPIDFSDDMWLKEILSLDDDQFSQYLQ